MKAEDFDGKRLMIFDNDDEGRLWKLSAHPSADGKSFAVKRRQTGIDTAQIGKESRFQFVQQIVDEATLAQFEKPKSPYLKNVCDLVWFSNSPQMRHRHRE